MTTIHWDVDTQVDFMHASGKLYVTGSEAIIPALRRLTDHAHARGIRIVASADDHVAGHRELSATPDFVTTFPDHCMRGTPGQRKIPETALADPLVIEPDPIPGQRLAAMVAGHRGDILFHKHWFDVFTNPNVLPTIDTLGPTEVIMYGVALDVCDRYAVEGFLNHRPAIHLTVVADAARAIDPAKTGPLLADWRARGVRIATTDEVIR